MALFTLPSLQGRSRQVGRGPCWLQGVAPCALMAAFDELEGEGAPEVTTRKPQDEALLHLLGCCSRMMLVNESCRRAKGKGRGEGDDN